MIHPSLQPKLRATWRCALGLLIAASVAGCYERVSQGDESIYRFSGWLGVTVILAGILGVPVGWYLRRWSAKWGFVVMVLSPILLAIVAPAMYSDRVVLGPTRFEARYGFWFAPSVHNIAFDDLREIRYVSFRDSRDRLKHELRCVRKDGQVEVVHAGDLVINAVPEILERAEDHGVAVVRQGP